MSNGLQRPCVFSLPRRKLLLITRATRSKKSHIFRTLGLGYANLGSLVMSYGYGYDSVEGRALCGAITAIMTGEAYEQSALLAKTMGPFPGYRDARCSGVSKPAAKDNVAP